MSWKTLTGCSVALVWEMTKREPGFSGTDLLPVALFLVTLGLVYLRTRGRALQLGERRTLRDSENQWEIRCFVAGAVALAILPVYLNVYEAGLSRHGPEMGALYFAAVALWLTFVPLGVARLARYARGPACRISPEALMFAAWVTPVVVALGAAPLNRFGPSAVSAEVQLSIFFALHVLPFFVASFWAPD